MEEVGKWSFIIGIIIAIVAGLLPNIQAQPWVMWVLVVLGLIVGFLNITDKETTSFLIAAIALMTVGGTGLTVFGSVGGLVLGILNNIVAFTAPGALVVALKAVYSMSSNK